MVRACRRTCGRLSATSRSPWPTMHRTRTGGRVGLIERFVPLGPEAYERHPNELDACERAGFLELP